MPAVQIATGIGAGIAMGAASPVVAAAGAFTLAAQMAPVVTKALSGNGGYSEAGISLAATFMIPGAAGKTVVNEGKALLMRINQAAGNAARDRIAAREAPAVIEQTFKTLGGARRVDVLEQLGNVAIESKVGITKLSDAVRQQLARDWWLKRGGKVNEVIWEFSPSPTTGRVGPMPTLQEKLDKLGFKTKINID